MKLKGTVTITLDDYHSLLDQGDTNLAYTRSIKETSKELSVFLSYISSKVDISNHIEAFNIQSRHSKIVFSGTKALIELRTIRDEN
jgi:hypothetical protein